MVGSGRAQHPVLQRLPQAPSNVGLSLMTTASPISSRRNAAIGSISSGGQPWKVDKVRVSEIRGA
jgi:hypothetical protein